MQQRDRVRLTGIGEDSCIAFANQANQRYLQCQQTADSATASAGLSGPYVADDSDLPDIFFQPVMAVDGER